MLLRFDPFQEFDRVGAQLRRNAPSMLAFDATRTDERITVVFDAPGVTADDLDVQVENNELTVTATRRSKSNHGDGEVVVTERPHGTFTRQLMLSDALDPDGLEAQLEDGQLIVTIPVSERSRQRKIEVSGSKNRSEAIETSSADAGSMDDEESASSTDTDDQQ